MFSFVKSVPSKVQKTLDEVQKGKNPDLLLKSQGLTKVPNVVCDNYLWLNRIDLQDNQIVTIPIEIYKLRSLKILQLGGNQLTILPPEIGMLLHLQVLELDNNKLQEIDKEIFSLRNLRELTLFNNELKEVPHQIGKLTSLQKLILEQNKLTSLPKDIGKLTRLHTLHAGNNDLDALPHEFGDLQSLTMLSVASNLLTKLPSSFGRLTSLTVLNLRSNHVTTLNKKAARLTNLTNLNLRNNEFAVMPPEMFYFTKLLELNMHGNKLTVIPKEIQRLRLLQKLYLQENAIVTIPPDIRYITRLEIFLLQENKLAKLPCEVGLLPYLSSINVDKNPLPPNIETFLSQGPHALLAHLKTEFAAKRETSAAVIQRWYRVIKKARKFKKIVKIMVQTTRQDSLVQQFANDLKKKQAVLKIQRWWRSRSRQKRWQNIVTGAANARQEKITTLKANNINLQLTISAENVMLANARFDVPDNDDNIMYDEEKTNKSPRLSITHSLSASSGLVVPRRIIKAATVVKIVQNITDRDDEELMKVIFYTLDTFTSGTTIFTLLKKRFKMESASPNPNPNEKGNPVQLRILHIFIYWIKSHYYCFKREPILFAKMEFFSKKVSAGTESNIVKEISKNILKALYEQKKNDEGSAVVTQIGTLVEFLNDAPKPAEVSPEFTFDNPDICLLDVEELARQLTLIDHHLLSRVGPSEFLNQAWTKPRKEINAPNLLALVERFNQVSNWVGTELCTEENAKRRLKKLRIFIKVAWKCYNLRNYNGVMQIITGLNSSAVSRLKSTWAGLSSRRKESLEELEKMMDMQGNFKNYRDLLANAEPPSVPFIGLFLTDFTFLDDGNPNFIRLPQLINIVKRQLISNSIQQFLRCSAKKYCLYPVSTIQGVLLNCEVLDDKTNYKHSQKLERTVSANSLKSSKTLKK